MYDDDFFFSLFCSCAALPLLGLVVVVVVVVKHFKGLFRFAGDKQENEVRKRKRNQRSKRESGNQVKAKDRGEQQNDPNATEKSKKL